MSTPAPAWLSLLWKNDGTVTEVPVPNADFLRIVRQGLLLKHSGSAYLLDSYNKYERTAKFYESVTPLKDLGNK